MFNNLNTVECHFCPSVGTGGMRDKNGKGIELGINNKTAISRFFFILVHILIKIINNFSLF
jgi:hypothetical protein